MLKQSLGPQDDRYHNDFIQTKYESFNMNGCINFKTHNYLTSNVMHVRALHLCCFNIFVDTNTSEEYQNYGAYSNAAPHRDHE